MECNIDSVSDNNGSELEAARTYLESRGVLTTTAAELHVQLIEHPSSEVLNKLLHFDPAPLPEAVIVIPNLIEDNGKTLTDGYYVRFFPPNEYNGKVRKFLRTKGSGFRPYILPSVCRVASNLEAPLYIVEKQVAAMLLHQLGFYGIALEGTWGAGQPQSDEEKARDIKRVLHRDLGKFSWIGRPVYLCFDSDFTKRESVLEGLIRAFILLTGAGACPKILRWDDSCKGLDDFIANKAGLNLEEQKRLITELTDPLDELNIKAAAADWIRPQYRPLFEREGRLIAMSAAARNNLAHVITKPLGASVGSLEKSWTDTSAENGPDSKILIEEFCPWGEEVDGVRCANAVCEIIRSHAFMREEDTWAVTLWIFLSGLMDHVTILPIAGIVSPIKRCGKTNLLGVMRRLCLRALAASAISNAGVYRTVNLLKPTLLVDEADTFLPENDELRGLLNSGHTTESAFKILINPDTLEPERFSTFCPKVIALIGELPATLADRAIQFKMSRKPRHVKTRLIRKAPLTAYIDVARQIRRWADDNWERILSADVRLPAGLNDRAEENWEILAQIATVLGGHWPSRIFKAATLIGGEDDSEGQMVGIYLLSSLRTIFKERNLDQPDTRELTLESSVICEELNEDPQAPWADWGKGKDNKGITQKKLAAELRKFQIKPFQTRVNFKQVRGYRWIDLEKCFSQYLPEDPPPDDGKGGTKPSSSEPPEPDSVSPEPAPEQSTPLPFTGNNEKNRSSSSNYLNTKELPAATVENQSGKNTGLKTGIAADNSFVQNESQSVPRFFSDSGGTGGPVLCFSVISTPEVLFSYLNALPTDLAQIALDIETFVPGEEARTRKPKKSDPRKGSALDWQSARIRLISLTVPDSSSVVIDLGPDPEANNELRDAVGVLLYQLQNVEILGHRLGFDLCFLEHEFGWRPSRVWDTWVAAELLLNDDIELVPNYLHPKPVSPGPTALVSVLKTWADIDLDKELGGGALSDFGINQLSEEQYAYSAGDTRYLPVLVPKLQAAIKEARMEWVAGLEMSLVPVMSHMELVGIPLRADLLDSELSSLSGKRSVIDVQIEEAMKASGFDPTLDYSPVSKTYLQQPKKLKPLNLNSSNLKTAYFTRLEEQLGIKLPRTQKSNRISFTKEVMDGLSTDPVAGLYGARAGLDALITGINQRRPFISIDGRVHPYHNQLSANSGRISTEEPPMSNVPKSGVMREAVAAPEGYVLVHGDLGLIEVRAQAHFTGDPMMLELFNLPADDPRSDIYRLFASWVESKRQNAVVPIEQIPVKGALRTQAKPAVLGLAYLMGQEEFINYARGYSVNFTRQEASEIVELYFSKFQGIKTWHESAWEKANADLVTEGRSHLGRRRLVRPPVEDDPSHRYRQAQALVNGLIQPTCADGMKLGLVLIASELPLGAELILSVHDEVLVLCPAHQAEKVGRIVAAAMKAAYRIAFGEPCRVPIVFEVEALGNWSQKK